MAVKECEECGGRVSTKAAACPHCGARVSLSMLEQMAIGYILAPIIGLVLLVFFWREILAIFLWITGKILSAMFGG